MAVIGTHHIHLGQRYIQIHIAPDGGGTLVASDEAIWLSADPDVQARARRHHRNGAHAGLPYAAYLITCHAAGSNRAPTCLVLSALVAQGYRVVSRGPRDIILQRVDPQAPEDAGASERVLLVEPVNGALARLFARLVPRHRHAVA